MSDWDSPVRYGDVWAVRHRPSGQTYYCPTYDDVQRLLTGSPPQKRSRVLAWVTHTDFINYPRFPTTIDALLEKARKLGEDLMSLLCEESFSIVGPHTTEWYSRRTDNG